MAKKKYYAVVTGRTPGIYFTWEDCKAQIEHFSGAVYKSFESITEAEAFIQGVKQKDAVIKPEEVEEDCLIAYVDGSYDDSQKRYSYGCVFLLPDQVVTIKDSAADEIYVSMRNVAGEILGSEKAIEWAIRHGYKKIMIYYDYEGIEKWADCIWKANKPGTINYRDFVAQKRENIEIRFCKVAAHTGDTYNEMADRLAKEALNIVS